MLQHGGVRLGDILQAVPALLQGLPSGSHKTLLHTSAACRWATQQYAIALRIPACDPCDDDPDIQLLVKGAWTGLQRLELHSTNLDATSVSWLRTGHWPRLKHLNVGKNYLDAEAIGELVLGDWPKLEELVLSNTRRSVQPSVQHLGSSKWTMLRSLELSSMELRSEAVAELITANWPLLRHLDLSCNQLELEAISLLVRGKWPQLKSLKLGRNARDTACVKSLSTAEWPLLEVLSLRANKLTQASLPHLVRGR